MTTLVGVVNRALQDIGSRTTVTSLTENSNEAIQANLVLTDLRDQLLRMAPWDCASNFELLTLITAAQGTPENTSAVTSQTWQKGLPPPPWAYEYQYPVDCLRALYVAPQFTTGFASGVPITTAVTGGAPSFWQGPPQKFKIAIDQFLPVTAAAVQSAGSGYAVGDQITLASGAVSSAPIGAPVVLQVTSAPSGQVSAVSVVSQVLGGTGGGSYFAAQTNPVAQGSTTGSGTGATFNLTFGSAKVDQRVILTNQEFALLACIKQITDPNVMDALFLEAWIKILGGKLVMPLTGDKALANLKIAEANSAIIEARKVDGNEGLTINDVTPDFIRARGIYYPNWELTPNVAYDWGPLFTAY